MILNFSMNYFALFGIPVQLQVDKKDLPRKYFELSKKYHPDYFINEHPDKQEEALEVSAQLNKAFKTLQDPDATINYVLKLKNLLEEEEKYELPKDFLMEVLEINEQLMDLDDDPDVLQNVTRSLQTLEKSIYDPVKNIIENYSEGETTEQELLQVKEYYYKKKYLQRISDQLKVKL